MTAASVDAGAPEIRASHWFNTPSPLTLAQSRGQVILLHTFQMLCPACVLHATPQAVRIWQRFHGAGLQVIGLHTVFEHHAVMTPAALAVYLHEFRIPFPVGVDAEQPGDRIPATMARFQLNGTPSTLLFGRDGQLRYTHFGMESDAQLAGRIEALLAEEC